MIVEDLDVLHLDWDCDPNATYLAVGWLAEAGFEKGEPSDELLDVLFRKVKEEAVRRMRGFHICPFCDRPEIGPMKVERGGESTYLGTAEIEVPGPKGTIYAAPTLIYHYVQAHHYAPPGEFVEAALLEQKRRAQKSAVKSAEATITALKKSNEG